jgi:hypothetical protein
MKAACHARGDCRHRVLGCLARIMIDTDCPREPTCHDGLVHPWSDATGSHRSATCVARRVQNTETEDCTGRMRHRPMSAELQQGGIEMCLP